MDKVTIEKKVPCPVRYKWPFRDMKVGDSFVVPEGSEVSARACAYSYGSRNGMKFCARRMDEGMRIWRVE